MLKVNPTQNGFIKDGKPFFYLADTLWSAFTNMQMEEWEYYLDKRKVQGFTVLQINTLPQWDRCMTDVGVYPFPTEDGQVFSFEGFCEAYYDRAREMCQMAVDKGFQLALVVLWLNFVPGTWGSKFVSANVMPEEFITKHTTKVVEEFDRFEPIYVVSGDTDFDTDEARRYYQIALESMHALSPNTLKTLHIKRGYDVIPESYLPYIDFYMFQSGHNKEGQDMAYILPENIREKYPKKPMLNAEPCYEQMGYSRKIYGRFGQYDVRKAAWTSILAGAGAGVTYGAHGVWNWQKVNKLKNSVLGEGFDEAMPWQEALALPGAWDYGFISYILEQNQAYGMESAQDILKNNTSEIRVGRTEQDDYYIYVPSNTNIILQVDLTDYKTHVIDLETKNVAVAEIMVQNYETTVKMHAFQKDVLIVAKKQKEV